MKGPKNTESASPREDDLKKREVSNQWSLLSDTVSQEGEEEGQSRWVQGKKHVGAVRNRLSVVEEMGVRRWG